ncbi:MAG: hypothetical protein OFPII_39180 [Osedax symbiont Rs1]|nr:MAG: hypothetical protein OFPII_39180 [Osedax symbiont Rs1]
MIYIPNKLLEVVGQDQRTETAQDSPCQYLLSPNTPGDSK